MVFTSPVNDATPLFTSTLGSFSVGSLRSLVCTFLAMILSSCVTAARCAGATTCSSSFTLLTPSMPLATSPAAPFASASSTFPLSVTTPSLVVTCTWLPLTRSSAKRAILVLDVIQESLTPVFTPWVVLLILSLVLSALSSILSFVVGLSALVCAKAGPVAKTSAAMLRLVTAIRCRIVHGSSRKIGSLPYRPNLGHFPLQHILALHDPSPRRERA